jgi:hypothetical protein
LTTFEAQDAAAQVEHVDEPDIAAGKSQSLQEARQLQNAQ